MDWLDILHRIEAGEDRHTEFKRSLDLSAIGKATCAFANTEGGVIILGVTNAREIVGVREDSEQVQERLTSFLHTGCSTPVSARTETPRHEAVSRCGTRLGALGQEITEDRAIQRGFEPSRLGFDTEQEPQPDREDDLRNRGVLTEIGGELRATVYGTLAFGADPQRYPQSRNFRVECVAYAGADRASEVLQVAEAAGRLDDQVNRAVGWFLGLGRFESYQALVRDDRHLLPRAAIREALVNAVTHRDYAITGSKALLEVFAGRVDVTSPGALPNHMTVERVRAGANPRSRNDSMAYFMAAMGFMEQRGRGWLIMQREMREFNGTEPELIQDERNKFVRVTFRLTQGGLRK